MTDEQFELPLSGRDWRTDAALRPQPKRYGCDDWTTPRCLCAALTYDVLTTIQAGAVWESAPGDGALVRGIEASGRRVVTTTADFLSCPVPEGVSILATNPPYNSLSAFIERSLKLLDAGALDVVILLFRHDHLQSESRDPPHVRIPALRRAAATYICAWRPTWIPGTKNNGRWGNSWIVWRRGYFGPPATYWPERRTR
jgi:hypothetical protein